MKIASPGSVAFNFDRMGVVLINSESVSDDDELLLTAVEAGAHECEKESPDAESYHIIVEPSALNSTRKALTDAGYEISSAQLEMVPKTMVDVSENDAKHNTKVIELLEDLDDVDGVYANMS